MATLIPNLNPESIENTGERLFYQAAANLPVEYTVLYSFKYLISESHGYPETIREADFATIHPALGYLIVEVKQGEEIKNRKWLQQVSGRRRNLPMAIGSVLNITTSRHSPWQDIMI